MRGVLHDLRAQHVELRLGAAAARGLHEVSGPHPPIEHAWLMALAVELTKSAASVHITGSAPVHRYRLGWVLAAVLSGGPEDQPPVTVEPPRDKATEHPADRPWRAVAPLAPVRAAHARPGGRRVSVVIPITTDGEGLPTTLHPPPDLRGADVVLRLGRLTGNRSSVRMALLVALAVELTKGAASVHITGSAPVHRYRLGWVLAAVLSGGPEDQPPVTVELPRDKGTAHTVARPWRTYAPGPQCSPAPEDSSGG